MMEQEQIVLKPSKQDSVAPKTKLFSWQTYPIELYSVTQYVQKKKTRVEYVIWNSEFTGQGVSFTFDELISGDVIEQRNEEMFRKAERFYFEQTKGK